MTRLEIGLSFALWMTWLPGLGAAVEWWRMRQQRRELDEAVAGFVNDAGELSYGSGRR